MSAARFVVDEQIPHLAEWLGKLGTVQTVSGRAITNELLRSTGAEALFVRSITHVDRALLDGTNITFVGSATSGTDHVDLDALAELGIRFASAPGSNAWAVAEYVVAMIFDIIKDDEARRDIRIGIIGYGHVGSRLALAAHKLGFDVVINDPPLEEAGLLDAPSFCRVLDLPTLCETCNIVTVHTPLITTGPHPTYHLITADLLARIPDGAIVINAARGGIIDERALVSEQRSGRLTAVLDVFEDEPNIHPETLNVVKHITPHIAGYSLEAKNHASWKMLEDYLKDYPRDYPRDYLEDYREDYLEDYSKVDLREAQLKDLLADLLADLRGAAGVAGFEEARKAYRLRHEVLRHWVYS